MTRAAILLLLAPLAANAQLQLLLVNGAQQTPITRVRLIRWARSPSNTSENFDLRALNSGSAPIPIASNTPAISGTGFSITSPATPPPNIAPGGSLAIYIHFAGGAPASYSATFQLNTASVVLLISSVAAATLSAPSAAAPDPIPPAPSISETSSPSQTAPCSFVLAQPKLAAAHHFHHHGRRRRIPIVPAGGYAAQSSCGRFLGSSRSRSRPARRLRTPAHSRSTHKV